MERQMKLWIAALFVMVFSVSQVIFSTTMAEELPGTAAEKINDVRVLIDISGSMKKNDPDNLRIPALRLITQLIPEGQQGGVWNFGQYVNMLVKHGQVDTAWKDQAYKVADEISSKGLYTNIETALEKSTWDWDEPDESMNRSIILLTDGVVDISRDADKNAESRSRILKNILPRLQQAGGTIHTIALSDDADKAFLRQLSSVTGGWNEIARDAARLERIFLKMFEKAVPVETLPLTDNKILVDDSIKELTLLVFRKEGARDVALMNPAGEKLDSESGKDGLRWIHEERYDLITIDKPMSGEWGVDAELDPDNRVMVVTDLKVRASKMPNMMMTDDVMGFYVELTEKGEVIRKPEFLDFVHVSLEPSSAGEHQKSIPVKDDGEGLDKRAEDGRFSTKVGGELTAGEYEYEMRVDGMTFKRSKKNSVRVVDKPVAVTVKEEHAGNPAEYSLTVIPFAELIKPDTLLLDTTIIKQGSTGEARRVNIPRAGKSEWRLDMKVNSGDIYDVAMTMQAERVDGRQVTYDLGTFQLGGGSVDIAFDQSDELPADIEKPVIEEEQPPVVEESEAETEDEPADEASADGDPDAAESGDEEESPDWVMVAVKIVGLNGFLAVIGYLVYRKWFRAPKVEKDSDSEEEAEDEDSDEKEAKA